ncbi:WD40-repeat-containing domain protein [Mucor mucedo]|uniref:WD40-repeat-containing domain protein n=1 Tax=Mucor mucedo TaxID=29922 RepID=UPI00221F62C5|nr:WD40-repeat-containing domain protein [Mucor mucedo]KAI7892019.1 WD40-repeat-containing domain protein [Mucor mucedo]
MTTIKEYAQKYNELSNSNEFTQIPLIKNEWNILRDSAEINTYMPSENCVNITTGITNFKTEAVKNFNSVDLSQSITNKRGHVLNTGGSVWALEFVPKKACLDHDHTQYLAVGGYNSVTEHHTFAESPHCRNAIQIWQCTSDTNSSLKPQLDMCILHDFGVVVDFKWCPSSVYDEADKLGIMTVLFGDGQVRVFVVPHPNLVREQNNIPLEETVYILAKSPRLLLKLPRAYNMCIAWGGYDRLACGTKLGGIIVWDILKSLKSQVPIVSVNICNASLLAIKCLSWISLLNRDILISSDSDGNINLHDMNDPFIVSKIFRVRCTYICIAGTGHGSRFCFGDTDGISRINLTFQQKKSVTLTAHNCLIWSIATSPFHGIAATAASDGTLMVKPYSSEKIKFNPKHKLNILEYTLYKLIFDNDTQTFRYVDGLLPKTKLPEQLYHNILTDPIVSIHKVIFMHNDDTKY